MNWRRSLSSSLMFSTSSSIDLGHLTDCNGQKDVLPESQPDEPQYKPTITRRFGLQKWPSLRTVTCDIHRSSLICWKMVGQRIQCWKHAESLAKNDPSLVSCHRVDDPFGHFELLIATKVINVNSNDDEWRFKRHQIGDLMQRGKNSTKKWRKNKNNPKIVDLFSILKKFDWIEMYWAAHLADVDSTIDIL